MLVKGDTTVFKEKQADGSRMTRRRPWSGAGAAMAITAGALALVVAGCGSSSSTTTQSAANAASSKTATTSTKTLQAATQLSYPPFEYIGKNGKITGFEVELLDDIASKLGDKVVWHNVPFSTIFTAIGAGKYDIAASGIDGWAAPGGFIYSIVKKRTSILSFSRPIYIVRFVVIYNRSKNPGLKTVADLRPGMTVALVSGSAENQWATQTLGPKGIHVLTVQTGAQAFSDVETGQADATFSDIAPAQSALHHDPDLAAGGPVTPIVAGIVFAFNLSDVSLRQGYDRVLGQFVSDGTYGRLFKKYFPGVSVPTLPTSSFFGQA